MRTGIAFAAMLLVAIVAADSVERIVPEDAADALVAEDNVVNAEDNVELLEDEGEAEEEPRSYLQAMQTAVTEALDSKGEHSMHPEEIHTLLYGPRGADLLTTGSPDDDDKPKYGKNSKIAKAFKRVYGYVLPSKETQLAALKALENPDTNYATKPIDKEQIAWSGMFKSCCYCGKRYIDQFTLPIGGRPLCIGIQDLSTKGTKCVYDVDTKCPAPKPKPKAAGSAAGSKPKGKLLVTGKAHALLEAKEAKALTTAQKFQAKANKIESQWFKQVSGSYD
jgi:hypothetical protein